MKFHLSIYLVLLFQTLVGQNSSSDFENPYVGNNAECVKVQQVIGCRDVSIQSSANFLKNIAFVFQDGDFNSGLLTQSGSNHRTVLLQNSTGVFGSNDPNLGNEANLWSEGSNTQNVVVQVGNSNRVNQFVENYYATSRSVISVQMGNENEINLALLDRGELNTLQGVMVTQTGDANSAELVLNQSDASYMTVTQSGGAEIKVTQTDFYFPMK